MQGSIEKLAYITTILPATETEIVNRRNDVQKTFVVNFAYKSRLIDIIINEIYLMKHESTDVQLRLDIVLKHRTSIRS